MRVLEKDGRRKESHGVAPNLSFSNTSILMGKKRTSFNQPMFDWNLSVLADAHVCRKIEEFNSLQLNFKNLYYSYHGFCIYKTVEVIFQKMEDDSSLGSLRHLYHGQLVPTTPGEGVLVILAPYR